MTTVNRKVLDLSHHNSVQSWHEIRAAGIVGIIHKATEGTSYVDAMYLQRVVPAMGAGLLWGAYHFANGSDVRDQVEHFLDVVGIADEFLYALDWEENPSGPSMSRNQAQEFLELMADRVGPYRTVIYSGNVAKEQLGNSDYEYFGKHRLWLAQYGTDPVCQLSWDDWWLWQYSDGNVGPQPHGCPGVSGYVDTNSFKGSDEQLIEQWAGCDDLITLTKIEPARIEITTSGNVSVLVNGKLVA